MHLKNINEGTYLALLFVVSIFYTIIFTLNNAFEWPTNAEIPLIAKITDPSLLINDFYSKAAMSSPKIFFSYLVYFLTYLGLNYHEALYLLKFTCNVLTPLLVFCLHTRLLKFFFYKDHESPLPEIIKLMIFIFSLTAFGFIQGYGAMTPFGWEAIQSFSPITPMKISFFIGLIYLISKFTNKKNIFSPILLFLSFLIHPAIGIFNFVIAYLFIFCTKSSKHFIKIKYDLFIGILAPLAFTMYFFSKGSYLSSIEFFEYFIELRHPHHYLVSNILNTFSLIWIILLTMPLLFSFYIYDKRMIKISASIMFLVLFSILIQFIFSEILPVKIIMELGAIRFTSYLTILFTLNIALLATHSYLFSSNSNIFILSKKYSSISSFIVLNEMLHKFQKIIKNKNFFNMFYVIFFLSFLFISYQDPIKKYDNKEINSMKYWINNNTTSEDIFFINEMDTVLFRILFNRAVFADYMMPFSEKYIEEFSRRYRIYDDANYKDVNKVACLNDKYKIDYVITVMKDRKIEPIYISNNWFVYDLKSVECSS